MSLLSANLLVVALLWNNIRFQSETIGSKFRLQTGGTPSLDLWQPGNRL